MGNRKVIEEYYEDVNNLADLLNKLLVSYKTLIDAATELNGVALSRKSDVKNAFKMAENLRTVINKLISALGETGETCVEYSELKNKIIKQRINDVYMNAEIEEEMSYKD